MRGCLRVIPLPPLPTQQRIGSILAAYDDLIEVNRRRVAILEEMARRLFEEWFVHLRFPGHETVPVHDTPDGPLPEGWRKALLGDLIQLAYGKALKADVRVPGSVPVIGSSGIVGWHNQAITAGPCIIVGRKGNAGSVILCPSDCFPIDTTFSVRTSYPIHYVFQQLKRIEFLAGDTAVPGLNRDSAHRMSIVIPSVEILTSYNHRVASLVDLKDICKAATEKLAATRDLVLPRLISGELSIADAPAPERFLEAAD